MAHRKSPIENRKSENATLNILVLGRSRSAEMRGPFSALERAAPQAHIERAESVDGVEHLVNSRNWWPSLGLVFTSWPDEFTRGDARRLFSLLPLTRWICCFGAWCESDGRNRDIWPLALRVPARCAESRIARELTVCRDLHPPLPLTAARDEIFEFDCRSTIENDQSPIKSPQRTVGVLTPDPALRHWLDDLLTCAGASIGVQRARSVSDRSTLGSLTVPARVTVDAVVWDVDPWSEQMVHRLREFRARNPHVAILALMAFAHPEDVDLLKTSGADAVVSKLTPADDLLSVLGKTIMSASRRLRLD